MPKPVATAAVDGAKLFTACSGCHGAKGEKKALGKSQIIGGWESARIVTALKGYKDGTYGGAMKAVMKGQASKLSDAEIKALADYISEL
ncbi:MAG: c-type cytochrome [Epsilonproteobacteria bacterium]|nr:c-type cytochrome [Campylobacterota bacterium]